MQGFACVEIRVWRSFAIVRTRRVRLGDRQAWRFVIDVVMSVDGNIEIFGGLVKGLALRFQSQAFEKIPKRSPSVALSQLVLFLAATLPTFSIDIFERFLFNNPGSNVFLYVYGVLANTGAIPYHSQAPRAMTARTQKIRRPRRTVEVLHFEVGVLSQ